MVQFGFVKRGNCNIAKIMMWYQSKQNGFSKHLLIDIKKAFDSIDQNQLKEFLQEDFQNEQLLILLHLYISTILLKLNYLEIEYILPKVDHKVR